MENDGNNDYGWYHVVERRDALIKELVEALELGCEVAAESGDYDDFSEMKATLTKAKEYLK